MALLRNLRNIFSELKDSDRDLAKKLLEELKSGVIKGNNFHFVISQLIERLKMK